MKQVYVTQMSLANINTKFQENQKIDFDNVDDIQKFVKNATWRDILLNMVETNKLNVWNINIDKLMHSYLNFIKKLKFMDLYIPANIIFAASIMLRLKSNAISFDQIGQTALDIEQDDNIKRVIPEIETIYPRLRLQPNKKITLEDLLNALNEAMAIEKKYIDRPAIFNIPINIAFGMEIDEKIKIILDLINKNIDSQKMTTFERLRSQSTDNANNIILDLFIPLLYLMQRNKIILFQDLFFGDILIKISN